MRSRRGSAPGLDPPPRRAGRHSWSARARHAPAKRYTRRIV